MDIVTLTHALGIARQSLSAMVNLRDFSKAAGEIAKLQESLMTTQQAAINLHAENIRLSQEMVELKKILTQRARYELYLFESGFSAYRLKRKAALKALGDLDFNEPQHFICQRCMDTEEKRIVLQPDYGMGGCDAVSSWVCPACKTRCAVRR